MVHMVREGVTPFAFSTRKARVLVPHGIAGETSCCVQRKNCVGWDNVKFNDLKPGDVMRMVDPSDGKPITDYAGQGEFQVVTPEPDEGIRGLCLQPIT